LSSKIIGYYQKINLQNTSCMSKIRNNSLKRKKTISQLIILKHILKISYEHVYLSSKKVPFIIK